MRLNAITVVEKGLRELLDALIYVKFTYWTKNI